MSADRPWNGGWRRLTAGVAALACATVLGGGPFAPAGPAHAVDAGDEEVRSDPEVLRAETELLDARDQLATLRAQLDEAAAAYEHARAHHVRLTEEADASTNAARTARQRTVTTRAAWGQRIAEAYKRPEGDLSLSEAILGSPDPATAVHRAALVTQVTARGGDQVAAAQRVAEVVSGQARQQQVVGAGTAAAAAELEKHAERLERLAGRAGGALDEAQRRLARTEQVATERVETRRRAAADAAERARAEREAAERARARAEREAAERARARAEREAAEREAAERSGRRPAAAGAGRGGSGAALPVAAGGPAPAPVAGKVCPVGTPNGFIDSWGFPRSGGRRHQGVDIFAARGTPLYAVADGVVSRVGSNSLGGLVVDLVDDHGDRYYYAHLHTHSARQGQRVRAGDVIGTVGNTGNARTTPPHLHWQYHPGNGAPVNPYPLAAKLCKGS